MGLGDILERAFTCMINQFEQCCSLDAFKELQNYVLVGIHEQDQYPLETKKQNNTICQGFIDTLNGDRDFNASIALSCLENALNGASINDREKAATMLGGIGTSAVNYKEEIASLLRARIEKEPEFCVKARIKYSLEQIN